MKGSLWRYLSLLVVVAAPAAALTATSIPFSPHGDAFEGSAGAPVRLTPSAILVAAEGADMDPSSADDVVLLVEGLGGSPTITELPTPYLADFSGGIEVLSPTRALVIGAGADGDFSTGDEVVFLLDDLGGANTVTPIDPGGALDSNSGYVPTALSANSAVVATEGANNSGGSIDDHVALLTGLGTTNTVTPLAAPFLRTDGSVGPVKLSPTAFLISSRGPNGVVGSSDDILYLFTSVGGANSRSDLATPFLGPRLIGRAERLTNTRALVGSQGLDSTINSLDDGLYLLDHLGGANDITFLAVPSLQDFGAGHPVRINDAVAVVSTEGADSSSNNADDSIWVLSGLGATNTRTEVVVGALDEDIEAACVRLSDSSCAVVSNGPDNGLETADDRIVTISGIGSSNQVGFVTLGGLGGQSTSAITMVSPTSVLVSYGGPNFDIGTGDDDRVAQITDLFGIPMIDSVEAIGDFAGTSTLGHKPVVLSSQLAVFLSANTDGDIGVGSDDLIRAIELAAVGSGIAAPVMSVGALTFAALALFATAALKLARAPARG